MTTLNRCALLAFALSFVADTSHAQARQPVDALKRAFTEPPESARPRVWWHWMNANVTIDGIDKDFAWMKRVGIGGVQNFDGSLNTPRIVATPLPFMSEGWKAAFQHAVKRADSLGLEFTIASSPGWSETGGPWVKPEQAMKKLVWSERIVEGGAAVSGPLPTPPSVSGTFQDIAAPTTAAFSGATVTLPSLYRDAAVVAYRMPASENDAAATVSASSAINAAALTDGDRTKSVELPFGTDSTAWVRFAYAQPTTVRAMTIVATGGGRGGGPPGQIQVSDDGTAFRTIAEVPRSGAPQQTISLPSTTTRYLRVLFRQPAPPPAGGGGFGGGGGGRGGQPIRSQQLAELTFSSAARVHRFEDKAGFSHIEGLDALATPRIADGLQISKSDVIDLTARMRSDGTLDWTPPAGRWRVLRLGWSPAGTLNRPASPEGTGLEVDKLNADHVRSYLNSYLGIYEGAAGATMVGKRGVRFMLTDSYEAAASNWTDKMIAEFTTRRGYSPMPWLPVLTGRVVESAEASDRFLWDYRRTLSDLIADNHYGELSRQLHARGLGRYGESHEVGRAFIGDGMEVKKSADVPMGATWYGRANGAMLPDIRESAAVAHLYGQNLVAAESFTTSGNTYAIAPDQLKPTADLMMANGLNRFVIHTSVHQPLDSAGPGVGLGPFGEWFTRKETWAEQAGAWMSYLSRSSHLLQQGRFAADIAWFYGEDDNITAVFSNRAPAVPAGYAWDFVNGDALRNVLTVKNGRLIAPGGASYRMLVLDPAARRMTVATLKKLGELVKSGAIVVGEKPSATPSLADDPAELARLADALWSGNTGTGKVFATVGAATSALGIAPDVDFRGDTALQFVHRTMTEGEIYFVANRTDRPSGTELSFRVAGKAPELWRADDGSITPLSYRTDAGRTVVTLTLPAGDAAFVVFRTAATAASKHIAEPTVTTAATLSGPWTVAFPANRGAPAGATFPELTSWTSSADPGVRYFSGSATYAKEIQVPAAWRTNGARVILDLGSVKNVADVRVNGRPAGIAWKAPFQVDITDAVLTGTNRVEILVSNLWPNRLIGDKQPGVDRKYAYAVLDNYRADSPLLPSGLLGPVRILLKTSGPSSPGGAR